MEYEFRGKDKNGEWHYGYLLVRLGIHYILSPIWEMYRGKYTKTDRLEEHEVLAKTVGQYTNFKDKDHVKAFEGDVLRDLVNNTTFVVEFDDCGFQPLAYSYALCSEYIKIIGNIHDNPNIMQNEQTPS